MRFCNVLLNQHRFSRHQQALDKVAHFECGVPQENAVPLRTLGHLHHDGKTAHGLDGLLNIDDVAYIHGFWNRNSVASKDLGGVEFVAALQDTEARVGRPYPQLLDVAQHRHPVLCDGMPDPRDNRIVIEMTASVQHVDRALADHQRELHWIANLDLDAALFWLLPRCAWCCKDGALG